MTKSPRLLALAATIALSAIALASPARAQDAPAATTTTTAMVMPMSGMSEMDKYKAQWVFLNLDKREVARYKAMGFDEATIKGAANIALRSGVSIEYVLGRVRTGGSSLTAVAAMLNVPANVVSADIPGMGMGYVMMTPGSGSMTTATTTTTTTTTPTGTATTGTTTTTTTTTATGDIVSIAMGDPQFSTLVNLLKSADLVSTLQGSGPFTVFAPTNDAFRKLPASQRNELYKRANKNMLRSLLMNHVVSGRVASSAKPASVVTPDIPATNGVIHAIDTVMMP